MSKRKTGWTEAKIARYYKEGRGQGELANYKPWLTTQDVPSEGRNHRFMGWKTNREHQFFSDLEYNYLCIMDWVPQVVDIREQFPLDRMITVEIADKLGINHSSDTKSGTPIVMTTDYLLTIRENNKLIYKARTIKPSKELNDKRTIQKFEIERIYWEDKGVDWSIVTEKEMSSILCDNLHFLRNSYITDVEMTIPAFLDEWGSFSGELLHNLKSFETKYNYEKGTGISLYRHLLARKILSVDMTNPIDLHENVQNIRINTQHDSSTRWA